MDVLDGGKVSWRKSCFIACGSFREAVELYAQNMPVLSHCEISDRLTILSLVAISCEMKIIKVLKVYHGDLII